MKALEETFAATMPREMGYDYSGMSFQEKKAQQGVSSSVIFGFSLLFVFLILAALYESRTVCSRVAVMYLGKLVEVAPTAELFTHRLHPYTEALCSATPLPNPRLTRARVRIVLSGDLPSPVSPPSGCRFHSRCPRRMDRCAKEEPPLLTVSNDHSVACHLYSEVR